MQTNTSVYDISYIIEFDATLIQGWHCLQQMECLDVPLISQKAIMKQILNNLQNNTKLVNSLRFLSWKGFLDRSDEILH